MPTYAFTCPKGHQFDVFERKISSKLKSKCPTCGKMATRQISGGSGFHLKGSGFYGTDYKSPQKGDGGEKGQEGGTAEQGQKGEKTEKGQKGQEIPTGKEGSGKGEKGESSAPSAPPPSPKKDSE